MGDRHALAQEDQEDEVVKVGPERQPLHVQAMLGDESHAESWHRVLGHLETSTATYWLATANRDGTPQVRPVLAVWVEGGLYFCAGERTRKARNLGVRPDCVVSVEVEPIDLVIEGKAVKVDEPETLRRVADAYASIYDWHVAVRDGAFHDTRGAPTAGPPPYEVYEVVPATAFAFGTDESFRPTRWAFE